MHRIIDRQTAYFRHFTICLFISPDLDGTLHEMLHVCSLYSAMFHDMFVH